LTDWTLEERLRAAARLDDLPAAMASEGEAHLWARRQIDGLGR
jgi:hypothetical protein